MPKKTSSLETMRHSCSHVLAAAVLKLYPQAKLGIGPAIEDGFYYDFDFGRKKITEKDLEKISALMIRIIRAKEPFKKEEVSIKKAKEIFKNQPYKLELIQELSDKSLPTKGTIVSSRRRISVYHTGDPSTGSGQGFVDLCAGPHVSHTGKIGPFKLLSIAGAYWRGDEKNKMLTRVYGACFPTKKELDEYLKMQEEAKKRDHRKLGKELDLFILDDSIGKGLPLLTSKGNIIRQEILDYERRLEEETGFLHVWTPHIARSKLYKLTGHWQHYRETMYSPFGIDGEEYVLKPMNCPHHYAIYSSRQRSYKDLPFRIAEPGTCYRYEKSGELTGLIRVRALTIDDSHILMAEDQIEQEFGLCIQLVEKMFKALRLSDYYVRLSLNDPSDKIKYMANPKTWNKAGKKLERILKDHKMEYIIEKGEASFYGPKIDYMVKDCLGREWQMSTLQLDLFMAKKLNLTYIDKDGKKQHPVILHRGLTGAIERTLGILIEHFAGAFPVWLSPVQVKIITITDKHVRYAQAQSSKLKAQNIRAEIDERNDTASAKIRDAELQKIPYMLIVGEREVKNKKVNVRTRGERVIGMMTLEKFIKKIVIDIAKKRQV